MHGLIFQYLRLLRFNSPQIVGDTQAPLLRIVRNKGQDGETISQYYDRPQYLPLVRHSFQTIQAELKLKSGDFNPFERGQIGSGLTHYKGINFQKGYGIGEIFRQLFRADLPFLVKGEAVKTRSRESWGKFAQKAIDGVQYMVGKEQYKRKRKKQKKFISSKARKRKLYVSFAENHLPVYKDHLLHLLNNKNCESKLEKEAGKRKRVDLTVSSKKKKTQLSTSAESSDAAPKNSTTVPEYSAVSENSTVVPENSNIVPENIFLPPKESESAFQKAYKTFDLPNNYSSLGIKEFLLLRKEETIFIFCNDLKIYKALKVSKWVPCLYSKEIYARKMIKNIEFKTPNNEVLQETNLV
ncbi:uncharacterized protein TNCV_3981561 [Trichonephila clavipes]|nr:uncharacterized protein TNCV_3981561 [Trichonephila clavipes]